MRNLGKSENKNLLIVLPKIGIPSEIWSFYQAEELAKTYDVHFLTWERQPTQQNRYFDRFPVETMGRSWERGWALPDRAYRRITRSFLLPDTHCREEQRRIRSVVAKIKPVVILAHFEWTARALSESLDNSSPPVICHVHGRDVGPLLDTKPQVRRQVSKTLHFATHVICVGESQRDRVVRTTGIGESKTSVIPCGANQEIFKFCDRSKRPGDTCVRFIQVGRMSQEKGWHGLLEAFAEAASSLPDIHLDLVGDGELLPSVIEHIKALEIEDRCTIHGQKSGSEVGDLLENADVAVQNSRDTANWSEGFGVTLCEAASTGLPLIASKAGGLLDQMQDGQNGILVEQDAPLELARAITRLGLSFELRMSMGKCAYENSRRFGVNRMTTRLSEILTKVSDGSTDRID